MLKVSGVSHSLKRLLSLTDPERNRWKLRDKLVHYSRTKTIVANTSYSRCYLSSAVDSSCTHAYSRTYQYQTVCLTCLSNNFLSDIDEIIRWLWKEQNNLEANCETQKPASNWGLAWQLLQFYQTLIIPNTELNYKAKQTILVKQQWCESKDFRDPKVANIYHRSILRT